MPDPSSLRALAEGAQQIHRRAGRAAAPRWYNVRNAASGRAEVYIYDMIGEDGWGGGVTSKDFITELRAISAPVIELHLNSEGGSVFEGIAIHEALTQHPARVEVVVDSLAASAASFIAMAGDRITMAPNARLMIHDAGVGGAIGQGNEADLRAFAAEVTKLADLLGSMSTTIAEIYAARAGGTVEHWRNAMLAETWYTASEAVACGLADGILGQDDSTTPAETQQETAELDSDALIEALKGAWA